MDLNSYGNEIEKICEKEDISVMGVFGSVARGQERKDI